MSVATTWISLASACVWSNPHDLCHELRQRHRGGRRMPAECACQPEPRRIQLTPKQIDDGPIICGLCYAPFDRLEGQGSAEG